MKVTTIPVTTIARVLFLNNNSEVKPNLSFVNKFNPAIKKHKITFASTFGK